MRLLLSYKPNVSLHVEGMAKADHNIRYAKVIDILDLWCVVRAISIIR